MSASNFTTGFIFSAAAFNSLACYQAALPTNPFCPPHHSLPSTVYSSARRHLRLRTSAGRLAMRSKSFSRTKVGAEYALPKWNPPTSSTSFLGRLLKRQALVARTQRPPKWVVWLGLVPSYPIRVTGAPIPKSRNHQRPGGTNPRRRNMLVWLETRVTSMLSTKESPVPVHGLQQWRLRRTSIAVDHSIVTELANSVPPNYKQLKHILAKHVAVGP